MRVCPILSGESLIEMIKLTVSNFPSQSVHSNEAHLNFIEIKINIAEPREDLVLPVRARDRDRVEEGEIHHLGHLWVTGDQHDPQPSLQRGGCVPAMLQHQFSL